MKKIFFKIQIISLLSVFLFSANPSQALQGTVKQNSPKLVNYYLPWEIPNTEVEDLAKWDVLILDMEVQHNSLANLKRLRQLNPKIIILAYVYSEEASVNLNDTRYASLRSKILDQIDESWWLKDPAGKRVSIWGGTQELNITDGAGQVNGQRWNDFLPEFVSREIISTGLWDGVFFDNVWPSLSWLNNGNLDINRDGKAESKAEMDRAWVSGNKKILGRLHELIGDDYIIMANSHAFADYQPYLNGIMLESFPASWEADGTWSGSMRSYTNVRNFKEPKTMVISANTNNTWAMDNYRKLRFSLGSALLGDGFFSFDYGVNDHSQTWWYDEYEANLGKPISAPVNILDKNNSSWKKGLWRRDYENGIVIVNSTADNQNYVFTNEAYEKISGQQDRRVNNGAKVNMVSIMGEDAVVLLACADCQRQALAASSASAPAAKTETAKPAARAASAIRETAFGNGQFIRIFDKDGKSAGNGFFSYENRYSPGVPVLVSDIDNDKKIEAAAGYKGKVYIYRDGKKVRDFSPYGANFVGGLSLAAADLNGDGAKEIITGTAKGGGPQVRIFSDKGKALNAGFFAGSKNFRGGVNVAAADLNNDGKTEIITGLGPGGSPEVRVWTKDGQPVGKVFMAYDRQFRGGVSVAVGDINGDGKKEIITGAGAGGGPEVRVFSADGRLLNKFFAFDKNDRGGIKVMAYDINGDGRDEILTGSLK